MRAKLLTWYPVISVHEIPSRINVRSLKSIPKHPQSVNGLYQTEPNRVVTSASYKELIG